MSRQKIKTLLLYMLPLLLLMGSCKFDKILKSSDYQMRFSKSLAYYEAGSYSKTATLLESIQSIYRGTEKADSITYYLGMSSFHQGDYLMGAHYFRSLSSLYPNSSFVEESDFMVGFCLYQQSPRTALDQESTYRAIESFRRFVRTYPESDRVQEAKSLTRELQDKLVEKSFNAAKLYFDMERYQAAVIALQNSLQDFPDTKYREEILFLILKSHFLYAQNSIREKQQERYQRTLEAYYTFISEYAESQLKQAAERIYEDAKIFVN